MIDAMTVKMMTAAALAVSGAAAVQYQASQLTKREEMIAELISGIRLFRNEIYYTHDRLERVARRLTSSCSGCCVSLFSEFQDQLNHCRGRDTETMWRSSVENVFGRRPPLKDSDRLALMSAGLRLGRDDIEGQCRYLEKTAEELEVRLLEARKEKEFRSRLYKTLGLTAGCAAAILVF